VDNLVETISNIEVIHGYDNEYDGYKVTTNKQEIFVLISNDQSCCEDWGYFATNDEIKDFIGATLLELKLVDESLDVKKLNEKLEYGLDEGAVQFVNFETDRGTFQLAVYNAHNGYYSHVILIKSNQVKLEGRL
jgi:hypothetical protein